MATSYLFESIAVWHRRLILCPRLCLPVHSFRTLLADLATITKNQIQPTLPDAPTFSKITLPTQTQKKALDLLGVSL